MSSFSDSNFVKKLADLNNSQQSIQTLSLWLIHHRKHAKVIVKVWNRELHKAVCHRKLTFLYLANDAIQNSKKKGPELRTAFPEVLPTAITHTVNETDEKTTQSINRLVKIWEERQVLTKEVIQALRFALAKSEPVVKKVKLEEVLALQDEPEEAVTEVPRIPPDADELVKILADLENSASSDASIREKIADLPQEVSDVSQLEKVKDKESANNLSTMVEDACLMLDQYNGRLATELDDRKTLAVMLKDFISCQKEQLAVSEKKLEEYKDKLQKVNTVRKELQSHIQNLPDLTRLPDITGGLAPLPSAGDLFSG